MPVGRSRIAELIPHAGAMCLLDEVTSWDVSNIRCVSGTHHDEDNPLKSAGRLPALCGIEYAAQAMAVHGALASGVSKQPRAGYLISVRDVACSAARLDDIAGELVIDAEKLMGEAEHVMYEFRVRVGTMDVLSGRAIVALDAGPKPG